MQKHQMKCANCKGAGAMQSQGQVYPCGPCGGSGATNRPEVGPQDYVFEYTIPSSGTVTIPALSILSYDFLLKWLVAYTATPTDQIVVTDNNGYHWMNAPVQIQNWAGTGSLPFPLQPNLLLKKNTTITITVTGTDGDTGEIVLKGINLWDAPPALAATN
jgi:hypothetical protein